VREAVKEPAPARDAEAGAGADRAGVIDPTPSKLATMFAPAAAAVKFATIDPTPVRVPTAKAGAVRAGDRDPVPWREAEAGAGADGVDAMEPVP
jgi:hypothetical protein